MKWRLNPPPGATRAEIRLLYQPTSWEYVQFLYLANNGQNAFLANEGVNLLNAWLNTGMAEPHVMATATWPELRRAPGRAQRRRDCETECHASPIELAGGSDASQYQVWWNTTNPYFLPGTTCSTQNGCEVTSGQPSRTVRWATRRLLQLPGAAGRDLWAVQAMPSNRTAAFGYALVPGQ